jgi:antitoxin YefM
MISGIREKTVVKEGGKIEISSPDLPDGAQVEVIVVIEEQDTTEYLLSTEANRRHLERAMKDLENPENLIYINLEDFEEGNLAS